MTGLAVDAGHLYWATTTLCRSRAELDAGDLTPAFVHSANELDAVAIDAGHLYWTSFFAHGIERANLDATAAARLPAGPPDAAVRPGRVGRPARSGS
jgi:hypothetical protein